MVWPGGERSNDRSRQVGGGRERRRGGEAVRDLGQQHHGQVSLFAVTFYGTGVQIG